MISEHIDRCRARAAALGFELPADAYLLSGAFDGSTFLTPDSVTQRYGRMVARLGIRPRSTSSATTRLPYVVIAADPWRRSEAGPLMPCDDMPLAAGLAVEYDVSLATARRALALAQKWGLLERTDQNTLRVALLGSTVSIPAVQPIPSAIETSKGVRTMLTLTLRRRGATLLNSAPWSTSRTARR